MDLGLDALGYRYVGIDCGWTVADRLSNGSLTWNETLFPSGFPAVGQYIHDLGLLFGVYEDAGIKTCDTGIDQVGSLCMLQPCSTPQDPPILTFISSRGTRCGNIHVVEHRRAQMYWPIISNQMHVHQLTNKMQMTIVTPRSLQDIPTQIMHQAHHRGHGMQT